MEINKTVYKLDNKGKVRVLTISTSNGELTQESGLLGGKLVSRTSISKPKNIGKSKETNSQQQAISEAESKLTAKLEEGYFNTIEEAQSEVVILPMLAKSFGKEAKKVDWTNAYVQPKLDGMRCLKNNDKMVSRKNKVIDTLPHISEINLPVIDLLDGELYAHGLSFQENMKIIKKNRPESINVKYHVYDMVLPNLTFLGRYTILKSLVENQDHIKLVPLFKVNSLEEVQKYHSEFLSEGYEGTMIRWGNEGYKVNGRSSNLLKYKDFIDETYTVIDVVPSDKNPEQGVVHCEGVDNSGHKITFGCGMKFSHSDREEILNNKDKYIGQVAEVRFFEFTDDGLPRFPVCVGFRLDK